MKCYIYCAVVVLSALISETVQGHRLNGATQVLTPANAIVRVALEELDADNDGKISIQEVRNHIETFYYSNLPGGPGGPRGPAGRGSYSDELTGYILTFAIIADADASGFIEGNEMYRFASNLVTLSGNVQVARVVEFASMVNGRIHGRHYISNASISQIINGMDMNNDEEICQTEMAELLQIQRNRRWREEITQTFETADTNNDGVLNYEEFGQWLDQLKRDFALVLRSLAVYYRVVALAGRDVASIWAQTHH